MEKDMNLNQSAKEKDIETAHLKAYNASFQGKVEPQNTHHNARKEGFARKEMQQQQ